MEQLTYQQVLADTYEETAKSMLVFQPEYEEEEIPPEDKHPEELEDQDEFNKFHGDRNKPEHVIKPEAKDTSKSSSKNPTQVNNVLVNIDGNFRNNIVPIIVDRCGNRIQADPTTDSGQTIIDFIPGTNPSNFVFIPSRVYKNVTSAKMTSMEFANTFFTYSGDWGKDLSFGARLISGRGNNRFYITVYKPDNTDPDYVTIQIPDGNYENLVNPITNTPYLPPPSTDPTILILDQTSLLGMIQYCINVKGTESGLTYLYDLKINYAVHPDFVFFKLDKSANKWQGYTYEVTFPVVNTNAFKNGIGYNLGFLYTKYKSQTDVPLKPFSFNGEDRLSTGDKIPINPSSETEETLASEAAPDRVQDKYVYLQIKNNNIDWNLIDHQLDAGTVFPAFAKIQMNGAKNTIIYDSNYINSSSKEYFFQQPVNISRLEINIVDAFGNTLDLRNAAFSISLELRVVNDSAVYQKLLEL